CPLNRLLSSIWLSTSAFGGLLAFPAIPAYFLMVLLPLAFAYLAYRQLLGRRSRRILVGTCAADLVVGSVVGQAFYVDESLSNLGVAIILLAFAVSSISLWRIWTMEKSQFSQSTDSEPAALHKPRT